MPGFNGVRVPARYAMIAGLFSPILAGYGASGCLFRACIRRLADCLICRCLAS